MTHQEPVIEVRDLFKSFGEIKAVQGLDFTVYRGDIFGILGSNGSGKSTTIRILLTLVRPDQGNISIFGMNLKGNESRIKRRTGALIERPDFYNYLSAVRNLEIVVRYGGLKVSGEKIRETLHLVGLEKFMHKKAGIFSQGMKQRLGIAQAIIHDPELIILDEPANGLDPRGLVDMRNLILMLQRDLGKTLVLSSHILREVELIANRTLIVHDGRAVKEGNVEDLLYGVESKVKILVDDRERAYTILKDLDYVQSVEKEGEYLLVKAGEEYLGRINRELVDNSLSVRAIIPVKNLEDYYLSLT